MATLTRREAIRLGLAAGGAAVAGCSPLASRVAPPVPASLRPPIPEDDPVLRLLARIGYGAAPGEAERVRGLGVAAAVDEQLHVRQPDPAHLALRLSRLDVAKVEGKIVQVADMELRDLPENEVVRQMQQAALLRAVYSPNQVLERMANLWTDHFNIYARKGLAAYRLPRDQARVIRDHALGRFPSMVRASAKSPAMLAYLDNRLNRKGVPNENYARELMELHTLGVDGGYTQRDVQEVARCFTGWTIERGMRSRGKFAFDPAIHDDGPKQVLGVEIPAGGGVKDGERVIEILVRHPSTARHVARKIVREFLGDHRADLWTARLAAIYLQTDGDLQAMLRPLLASEDLRESSPLLKRPFDYVASSLRMLAADTDGDRPVLRHLEAMGQPSYEWPMPDGYPVETHAWTSSLVARWNFAFALCADELRGTRAPLAEILKRLGQPAATAAAGLLLGSRGPEVARAVSRHQPTDREAFALCLAAPAFQWR